jgi:hypothetical protein
VSLASMAAPSLRLGGLGRGVIVRVRPGPESGVEVTNCETSLRMSASEASTGGRCRRREWLVGIRRDYRRRDAEDGRVHARVYCYGWAAASLTLA